ncbi:hypothetical protein [Clostridium saccharoperbutylacetonicum]|uniref:hypothetical protein n=1 Tax=Clostridium saccharoperbutylacetonicum TaxID=36745 RepID=UPI0039EA923F
MKNLTKGDFDWHDKINHNFEEVGELLSEKEQQQKTYTELVTMVDNNQLIAGTQYILTDYATKYQQPDTLTIKTMAIERLVLTAISDNKFDLVCSSLDYSQDIIHYRFDLNKCEDGTTQRNGFITRRMDETPGLQINYPLDWRTMLWARWKPDPNNYMVGTTVTSYLTWTSGAAIMYGVYKVGNALYMAYTTNTPTSNTDGNVFMKIYDDITVGLLGNGNIQIGNNGTNAIYLIKGSLHERPTFGNGCARISVNEPCYLQSSGTWYFPNNVFGDNCGIITFGTSCNNNTFANGCATITFGTDCYSNYFLSAGYVNIFGSRCSRNVFAGNTSNTSFEANCANNVVCGITGGLKFSVDCYNNVIGTGSNTINFGANCHDNIIGSCSGSSTFGANCYNNKISYNCYCMTWGSNCYGNTIGHDSAHISMGSSCWGNVIGNSSMSIVFGGACYQNTIGNNCSYAFFGTQCWGNSIGDNSGFNTYMNNCYQNTIGVNSTSNQFGPSCWGNIIGTNCIYNNFGAACWQNNFGTGCGSNNIGPYNINNTFGDYKCNLEIHYMRGKNISGVTALNNQDYTNYIDKRIDGNTVFWHLSASNSPAYTIIA